MTPRALLGALAGVHATEDLVPVMIFRAQHREGRVIRSVVVEPSSHRDDEWIRLEFYESDLVLPPLEADCVVTTYWQ
jgi:hypothetical protein